jgi:hypothetical protein
MNIAIVPPARRDYMTATMVDGLIELEKEGGIHFMMPRAHDPATPDRVLDHTAFIDYAQKADLIFLMWGKEGADKLLAEEIGQWEKTIYIDGSEVGKNRRFDDQIQKQILDGTYDGYGKVDFELLKTCALYFRREKPYLDGIIPLPFGIETRYVAEYSPDCKKDIDFFCVFGQDEYPLLRREATNIVRDFCNKNGFTCVTDKMPPDEFYKTLARSKVGISVGGGGFDTARFWEILGNNCLMITEKIDISFPNHQPLGYKRIWEFADLAEFEKKLTEVSHFVKESYNQADLAEEYKEIIKEHSTKARVMTVLAEAARKGIIRQ